MILFEKFGVRPDGTVSAMSIVSLVLAILYILAPRDRLSEYLKGCCQKDPNSFDPYDDQDQQNQTQYFPGEEQQFEKLEMALTTDYQRENPATSHFARLDYLDRVKEFHRRRAQSREKPADEQRPSS